MAVYKEDKGTWRVIYRYTDWTGVKKQSSKRGFQTKREAQAWEREQQQKLVSDLDMVFSVFIESYGDDLKSRLRENTWRTKEYIIRDKLLPYFGKKRINEITAKDVITWQNKMLDYRNEQGEPYSPVYLKTLHNQLSAIFNHAVKFYNLRENPAAKVGNMGKAKNGEKDFWIKSEYLQFIDAMMDKPISYYSFQMLYWSGLRIGELLALTPKDFDFNRSTVSITKSYQRLGCKDIITPPKTEKGNRVINMPQFLCEEIQEYIKSLYKVADDARLFPFTKSYLHNEMTRGAKETGVKRISLHCLRHPYVKLKLKVFTNIFYMKHTNVNTLKSLQTTMIYRLFNILTYKIFKFPNNFYLFIRIYNHFFD